MIPFLSIFKSEMPNIVRKLKAIRQDIDETKNNLKELMELERGIEKNGIDYENFIKSVTDSFNVSLWAKDINGRFLFANKACCDVILKCTEDEAMNMRDEDFEKDALSQICIKTDRIVMDLRVTKRFIEHAVYESGDVYLDVLKNPLYKNGELIGTTGSAIVITNSIPEEIKKQTRRSNSIEIPVGVTMSPEMFICFMERRKESRGGQYDV